MSLRHQVFQQSIDKNTAEKRELVRGFGLEKWRFLNKNANRMTTFLLSNGGFEIIYLNPPHKGSLPTNETYLSIKKL